jgi:ABC-type branched-subunit amino acid transport system ATPase component/ABC-type branched-subunit amino acid transport system permease subunit
MSTGSQILEFAVLGLSLGGLYVLFALGIVIVHRGSGIMNFAHGAMAMTATYMFWSLTVNRHWAFWPAFLLGIAIGAGLGVAVHYLVMRPLRGASQLTRLIATLAILITLQSIVTYLVPPYPVVVAPHLTQATFSLLGARFAESNIWLFAIAVASACALGAVYRFTHFGRATKAVVESRRSLAAVGISPDRIAALNWAIGGALAAVAGMLLAPTTGLSTTEFTLLVLPGLAVAVIGRMNSFVLVLVGGLAVGVLQSELSRWVTAPGWSGASPFLLMIVVLVLRGRSTRASRQQISEQLPSLGSGRVDLKVVGPLLLVGGTGVWFLTGNWGAAFTVLISVAVVLQSFVVVTGYSGQLSLAQWALAGWGALICGRLEAAHGVSFWLAAPVGVAAAVPLGLIAGAVCLRTRGVYLSVLTLGLAYSLQEIVFSNPSYTGGVNQTNVPAPHLPGMDLDTVSFPGHYAVLCLVFFAAIALALANLRRSQTGRRLVATRSNERAAMSLGINVSAARVYAFTLGCAIAAAGGILVAYSTRTIIYTNFDPITSIELVGNAVIGGVGWLIGPLFGAQLQTGSIGTQLLTLIGPSAVKYLTLIGGLMLIAIILQAPNGLASLNAQGMRDLRRRLRIPARAEQPPAIGDVAPERVKPMALAVSDLAVYFGGVRALDGIDLVVNPGEVVGLIGPNGAGKTTLIDAVTGSVNRTRGRIELGGRDITSRSAAQRARAGIGRSFQSLELFEDLTVLENLRAAAEPRKFVSYFRDLFWPRTPELTPATVAAIHEFGLESVLLERPSSLPYGQRRLVGIARAVATGASVMLLDEPAAGLDAHARAELADLIRRLAQDWGMSVLLIEHDVAMVLAVSDRIYALNFGQQIASGTPDEIRSHTEVIDAYLGTTHGQPAAAG